MNKRLLLVTLFGLFQIVISYGQTYNMGNGTINTCGGTFYDSGGPAGTYANSQNFVQTFCSGVAGQCVQIDFTSFNIEAGYDYLTVYDGPNTSSLVLGTYTGSGAAMPAFFTSSSGCLTFQFSSDIIVTAAGWSANISCVPCPGSNCPPCAGSPPANDPCSGAQNLGLIPVPPACVGTTGGIGAWATFNTTNVCATAENPYTYMTGCQPSGNMPSPSADVWYMFNITGPTLNVSLNGLQAPAIGLYSGINCNNLIPRGCQVGSGTALSASFTGLAPGTYYLQVSGGNVNVQCPFTLSLQNNYDCQGCVIVNNLTVNPPPTNGTYLAGQTVTFCFTVSSYNQTSVNWLHGVVPTFGPGWSMPTLTTVNPANCSGAGTWNWYNTNVTSTATGATYGPGFYYESPLGSPFGVMDGNPGNNYGDNNPSNLCDWTFCWTISTLPPGSCVPGASLNISINTLGDGESGSWTSYACSGDPVTEFFATLACCTPPTVAVTNPPCFGQNNGAATATPVSTNPPWDFIWKDGLGTTIFTANNINGSHSISGLAPGNYSVTVIDFSGCAATTNFTITAPTQLTATVTPSPANCNGASTGSATANPTGGTGGYSYNWSPSGGNGSTASNLTAGTYTVTVTDANGCTVTASGNITQPNAINASASAVSSTCGNANGSVSVSASGGAGALTYSLNGGPAQPGNTFSGLLAGNYSITVTDANGCTAVTNIAVADEPSPLISSTPAVNVSCNGGNDGSITVNVNGGTGTINYSLNGGVAQGGNTFSNLTAGNYAITVTDANGCTATTNVAVTEPPLLTASASSANSTCSNANGSITVSTGGGTGAVTYSLNGGPAQGGNTFGGLLAGNYSVTVTDANGCTAVTNIAVADEPSPLISSTPAVNVSCNGGNDGSITVNVNGGTGAINYSLNGGAAQSGNTFSNLTAGNYAITVTDANGCTATTNVAVTEPPLLAASASSANSTCSNANGSITVSTGGGTGAVTYSLNGGPAQSGNTFNGLLAGNYSITVTDANGCTAVTNIAVADEPSPLISSTPAVNVSCNGGNDGSITVNVNGGTGAINYSLNGGAAQSGNTFSNLTAGNYAITVTDANGCTATTNVAVTEPPLLTASASSANSTCSNANGSITVSTGGGTGAVTYSLNGGPAQGGNTFGGLLAGNYSVTVTDANGCTAVTNIAVADEPSPLISSTPAVNVSCNGGNDGSITVNVNGGTSAINYSINGGAAQGGNTFSNLTAGNYSITVTDANGCTATTNVTVTEPPLLTASASSANSTCSNANGSITVSTGGGTGAVTYSLNGGPAQSGNTFNGLLAGNYSITVTDANGCTAVTNIAVADEPSPLISSTPAVNVSCNGGNDGSITVNVNGGTGAINYSLNGGAAQSGNTFSNLTAGNYSITVTDANGCTATTNVTVTEPPLLTASASSANSTCSNANGSITVSTGGGTGAVTYSLNGGPAQSGNTFNGLLAGNYSITVTDANGCTAVTNIAVADEPSPLISSTPAVNVSCNGGNNGSITVNVNGGTGAINYSINGGPAQPGNTFNSLSAGNYSITVTDANGCTATTNVAIAEPTLLNGNSNTTMASCGNSDGTITVAGNGGTPGYQYSITNGASYQASGNFTGLLAGNYAIIVMDANGCTATVNAAISNTLAPVISSVNSVNLTCFNSGDGTITINSAGGTAPLSYSINNGGSYQPAGGYTGLSAGNYNIIVLDALGCQATTTLTITEPPLLTLATVPVNTTCGQSNGSITVNANGGTGAVTYSLNGGAGQGANIFNNIAAGNYNITVTDANGCTATGNTVITDAPGPTVSNVVTVNVNCNGANNGQLTITTAGGTGAIQYSIDNGNTFQAANNFSGLAPGTFNIVVTDVNGCTATSSASITEPSAIVINTSSTPSSCGNSDGSLTVNAAGGTGALQYSINNGTTYQSGNQFNNILAGNYTVIVQDANGCTSTVNAVINNAAAPVITATAFTDVSCFGGNDGTITITASGGTGVLQYSINNGTTFQAGAIFNNLTQGNYNLIVQDANGCQASSTLTISQPSQLTFTTVPVNTTCGQSNGSITVNANGGTGAVTYSLNGGAGQGANIFNNIAAGNYNITVTDANGCTATGNTTITDAPGPVISNVATVNANCNGANNGQLTITTAGGTGAIQYSIDNGTTFQAANNFSGLAPGTFNIVVTDVNGCTATSSASITEPSAIVINTSSTPSSCGNSDGSLTVNAAGGTGALQYSINNGTTYQSGNQFNNILAGNYTVIVQDANGCTTSFNAVVNNSAAPAITATAFTDVSCFGGNDGNITINASGGTGMLQYSIDNGATWQTGNTFSNLAAGSYNLVVVDINGCDATAVVTINQPAMLSGVINQVNTTCSNSNGSITLVAAGGTGTYHYSINNGANFQPASVFNNLTAGNYNFVIMDGNGCQTSLSTTLTDAPSPTIQNISSINISCNGYNDGSLNVLTTGGTAPLQYSNNNGSSFQGTSSFTNLSPGSYSIVVSDANGCTVTGNINISEPAPINASFSSTGASCGNADGTITMSASGGSGVLQYSIDNGVSFQSSVNFTFLPSGNYSVIVMDANGCTTTVPASVASLASPTIASVSATNITCNGLNNGTITITAGGGTGALSYSIDGGISWQAGNTFSNLTPGIYNLVVTDANGCDVTSQQIISEPTLLTASAVSATATCGNGNGSITITANGGTAPLQYSNNNGSSFQPGNIFNNLTQGNYNMVVADANGCTISLSTTVANAPGPVLTQVNTTNITCNGLANGSLSIVVNGGTAPIQYSIDNGVTFTSGITFGSLGAGNYNLVISDANGCTTTSTALISEPGPIMVSYTSVNSSCGSADGSINITASGGTGAIQYSIDNGVTWQSSSGFNFLPAGGYNVMVMDANGCTSSLPATVSNDAAPAIASVSAVDITCNGLNNGSITINAGGGTGALSFSIDGGLTNQPGNNFSNLPPGIYNIVVTDANGCDATSQQIISEPTLLTASALPATATCGNNNGSLTLTANGGTGPYQYSNNNGSSYQPVNIFSNLAQGNYNMVVTDANGCSTSLVSAVANAAGPVITNLFENDITCFGVGDGEITIVANGGTPPLQYSIDNGVTFAANILYGSLSPGTYNIVVMDANGCTTTSTASLVQPTQITYSTIVVDAVCGNSNGSIQVTASGGSGGYTYSKDNGVTFQPSNIFNALAAGSYDIVVRDMTDCREGAPEIVANTAAPVILSTPVTNASCNGTNNGSLTVNVNGGTGAMNYSIDGGFTWQASNNFTNLPAGTYNISVSDANNCSATAVAVITEPSAITVNAAATTATCGNNDGTISIAAGGGTGTLTYSLNGGAGQTGTLFNNLAAGNYQVTVTDLSGCTATTVASVSNTNAPVITAVNGSDVTCAGQNNGSITLNASGGTGLLTYSIDNGVTFQPASTFNNLPGGTYSIVITDALGCIVTSSIIINEPLPLVLNTQSVSSTCGNSNGEILSLVNGGTGAIQYSINNGVTFQPAGTFNNLAQGSYTVLITDANGCTTTSTIAISNIAGPAIASLPVTDVTCNGLNNGTSSVLINGGTAPYNYSINGGATSQGNNIFNGLAPGNYPVLVTDANGCTVTSNFAITQPSPVTISVAAVNTTCSLSNGSVTATGGGGSGALSYSNNGTGWQPSNLFINMAAGTYQIYVQDANGCMDSIQAIISDAPGPQLQTVTALNASCNNTNNGSISLTANGGTLPLQYSINNGGTFQTSSVFNNLTPGVYNIVVSDANGCTSTTSQLITQPDALLTSMTPVASTCNGGTNGSATVTVLGGITPYNYQWSNGFSGSASATNLVAGTYTVTVSDANGCTVNAQTVVGNVGSPAISVIATLPNTCFNSGDGTMTVNISGGTGPFTYSINGGVNTQMTGSFSNLTAGNYPVTITDANGCVIDSMFTITQPSALSVASAIVNTTCSFANGTITLSGNGGTGSYTYSINGGLTWQPTNIFAGQSAGNYTVIIQDQNGCTITDVAIINDAPGPVIQSSSAINATCYNADDGQVSVTVSGGTAPLQFSIDNGVNWQAGNTFINLAPGNYNIIISDANGCTVTLAEAITEPDAILTSASSVASLCDNGSNGSASVTVLGGTAPYNYVWSNGTSGSSTITNLTAGSYTVTVSDANGCTVSAQAMVSNITGPMVTSLGTINSTCNGSDDGSSVVQLTGGTGPFSYTINGGVNTQMTGSFNNLSPGNYTVIVTDANGCLTDSVFTITEPLPVATALIITNTTCSNANGIIDVTANGGNGGFVFSNDGGITFQPNGTFNNVIAGSYTVIVQDVNGCTGTTTALVNDAPGPDVSSVTPSGASCFSLSDGSLSVSVTGGTAPLQYSINNGVTFQTGNQFSGLTAGNYTILITDANGCTSTGAAQITEPTELLSSTSVTDADCNGASTGSASVSASGGTSPYSYQWSNGTGQPVNGNIAAGTYTVTVTDGNGCTSTTSALVTEPLAVVVTETISNPACNGYANGSISLNVSGGIAPYSYFWSVPNGGAVLNNLQAGSYSVTVTDNNGCTVLQSYTLTEPSAITSSTSSIAVSCYGYSNGSVSLNTSGGTPPYSFLWSTGAATGNLSGVTAGTYTVTVTDNNGCTGTISEIIATPDALNTTTAATAVTCNGYNDGTASVSVIGGTAPYSYQWSNGGIISTISNTSGGLFTVTITDANNCITTTAVQVQEPSVITVAVSGTTTLCIGQSATISATAQGGNGGFTYVWSNGITGSAQQVNPTATTSYTVNVTDSLGCSATGNALLITINPPLALVASPTVTICEGDQAQISAMASGGDGGPYTYYWSGLSQTTGTVTVNPNTTTTYTVTVTDGCTTPAASAVTMVEVNALPIVSFTPIPASGCAPLEVFFDNGTITTTPGAFYTWYFGDNTNSNDFEPLHLYTEPGSYTVTLKALSAEGCMQTLTVPNAVVVYPVPVASFTATPPITTILNPLIGFNDTGHGANAWWWDFGDQSPLNTEQNPSHSYPATGLYEVILYVQNQYGCRDTARGQVVIEGASTVYIPNAFSPNNDGVNDFFNVQGIGLDAVEMSIFNRWGQIVFISENTAKGWDGTDLYSGTKCPIGVYVYKVTVKSFKGDTRDYTGRVTLVK